MNTLLEQFLSEARDALEGIGEKLMQLEGAPDEQSLMTELFRLVHTLKGNSGLFEFPEMTRVLHAGEDLMDAVRQGKVSYSQALADGLLDATDFVGLLCDDIEHAQPHSVDTTNHAVALARSLRALMTASHGEAKSGTAFDGATEACSATPSAAAPSLPLIAAEHLARIPQRVLDQAAAEHGGLAALRWIRYSPDEECFYQGSDPLHQAKLTPGLLWGGLVARGAWPALTEVDAYRCLLDFDVLSVASEADILAHYRYTPEQIQICVLVAPGHAPEHASAPAPEPATASPTSSTADALRELLDVQREILGLSDSDAWMEGRIKGVVSTLTGCLRASHRAADMDALNAAAAAALNARSAAPLAQWMDAAFLVSVNEDVASEPNATSEPPDAVTTESGEKFGRRADDHQGVKSLKVDQSKIDRLMNLIGEMVVAKNAIPYLANRAENVFGVRELSREIKAQYTVINRISEEMQDAIMQVRMMPVSFVFQRFPRLVRDTSRRLGKEVNLVLEGQDTAADKNIIESLGDPLVHIVRNSLDHGLESPETRLAANKPTTGTLRISARQESDRVVIEISDDGKGIDPDVVKHKAYQKGLIDEQTLERITDQEAIQLVFAPGFSTAETVSDLSGRGVGMDVVRTAIERVHGSIALDSTKGKGTVIRLSLPMSMAVTNVMTIESNGQLFGIPIDAVVETVRIPHAAVKYIKQHMATVLRGRVVPLQSLNQLLGLAAPPLTNDSDEYAALVIRAGEDTFGILVDDFHETTDIILKPMQGVLSSLRAYAGSALMGDGSVLMVLNPKELVQWP